MSEEKIRESTPVNLIIPLIFGLLAAVCGLATAFAPWALMLTLGLGSAFFALSSLFDPFRIIEKLVPVVFFIAALLLTDSLTAAVFLLGVFFPAGIALSRVLEKRKGFNSGTATQFLVLCIYLMVLFAALLLEYGEGFDPESVFAPFRENLKAFFSEVYALIPKDGLTSLSPYIEDFPYTERNFVYILYKIITTMLPAYILLNLLGASALSYWTVKSIVYSKYRRDGIPEELKFFGGFDTFRASKAAGAAYTIIALFAIFSMSGAELMALSTFRILLSAVFCYEAVSLAVFALKMHNVPKAARLLAGALLTGMCFFVPVAQTVLALIGLADCFYNLRRFINPSAYAV